MDTFKLSNSQPMCAIKYQISSRGHLHYIKRYMILFVRRRQIFIMSTIQCHHVLSSPHYFMVCSSQVQCVRIGVQTSFPQQHEHTDVTWQASLEVCYSLAPMLRNLLVVELRRSPLEFLVNYRSSIFLGSKLDITIVLFFQVVWRRGMKTARQDALDPRLRSQVCLFTVCSPTGNHDTKCSALTVTSRCLRPRARLGVGTGSAGRLRVGHIPRRVV